MAKSQLDKAIASLEAEIQVLQLAKAKLMAQRGAVVARKPRAAKAAKVRVQAPVWDVKEEA